LPVQKTQDDRATLFFCYRPKDIHNSLKLLHLTPHDLFIINPNTRTLPVFRTRQAPI